MTEAQIEEKLKRLQDQFEERALSAPGKAIKGLEKSIVSIMERVANSTDQVGRNVRGLQD